MCVSLGVQEQRQPAGSADPALSVQRCPDQNTLSHSLTGGLNYLFFDYYVVVSKLMSAN